MKIYRENFIARVNETIIEHSVWDRNPNLGESDRGERGGRERGERGGAPS